MTLTRKLTLAFLLVAVTAAVLVALSIRATSATRLNDLILQQQRADFATLVTDYYQQTDSLIGLDAYLRETIRPNLAPAQGRPNGQNQPRRNDRRNLFGFADAQGNVIVPLAGTFQPGQRLSKNILAENTPLEVDGVLIGTILSNPLPIDLTPEERTYLERTNNALTLAALGAILFALMVGFLLARTITRPLRALTLATEKMAGGDLNQRVEVNSTDEIGELGNSFNRMSEQVSRANLLRKQMTADIAHDLRTPLTVISGYVESIRDGDLAPTPERLETIHTEIQRLQSLVEDLRLLALTDAGELRLNLQSLSVKDLLEGVATSFKLSAQQKGIELSVDVAQGLPAVRADEGRLNRVLGNLVGNALRHTPQGGRVMLRAGIIPLTPGPSPKYRRGESLTISIEDTGEGISTTDLPHIFDRLYRADKSRTEADDASSGLGLAIAKALVEAHGGRIWAESDVGRGTRMVVELQIDP